MTAPSGPAAPNHRLSDSPWPRRVAVYASLLLAILALSLLPLGQHGSPFEWAILMADIVCLGLTLATRSFVSAGFVVLFAIVAYVRF